MRRVFLTVLILLTAVAPAARAQGCGCDSLREEASVVEAGACCGKCETGCADECPCCTNNGGQCPHKQGLTECCCNRVTDRSTPNTTVEVAPPCIAEARPVFEELREFAATQVVSSVVRRVVPPSTPSYVQPLLI